MPPERGDPVRIPVRASLKQGAARMNESRVGALPIVDDANKVKGILTRTDVARALHAALGGGRVEE